MSDAQKAEMYEMLIALRREPTTPEYPFNRGWNAVIDLLLEKLRKHDAAEAGETAE